MNFTTTNTQLSIDMVLKHLAKVAKARSTRHAVYVRGKRYRSSFQAFQALGLPTNKHNHFRMVLKAAGRAIFKVGKQTYTFRLIKTSTRSKQ